MVYVILENIDQNKKFKVKNNIVFSYMKDNSLTAIPIPELSEEETPIIKVAGTQGRITINFTMLPDTEDLSLGTHFPAVRSVWDQIEYLSKYFVTEKVSERHRLVVPGVFALGSADWVREGAFTKISVEFRSGVGERAEASIDLIVGLVT
jgi:hypothetical protein